MVRVNRDRNRARRGRVVALALLGALGALSGCSGDSSITSLNIDPGRYSVYRCPQLVTRLKELDATQKKLSELMSRAADSTGGEIIGTLTYRAKYENNIADRNLVLRTAAEKSCDLEQPFQSDQSIR